MEAKSFEHIKAKIQLLTFSEHFDLVVAIARGGIMPAALLRQKLDCDMELLWLNLRNEQHQKVYEEPLLLKPLNFSVTGKTVLLVDDRSRTGTTLEYAKKILADAALIKTFVINGKADYALFDEPCFRMPWH